MGEFIILTDNTVDLPASWMEEREVDCEYLPCTVDGIVYDKKNKIEICEFYKKMREGSMPTTSQINPTQAETFFESFLQEGKDILYIAFSSGLSGTYSSCTIAAEELKQKYPDRRIEVIDTLAASMGEGLILYYAVKMKQEGKNMDEIISWILENRCHVCHVFTVDDLNHLHRGGRVSKATAVLGTLVNIKPMLHVDEEGRLTALGKVRGRKKSLSGLISMMEERIGAYRESNDVIYICHGDCEEDAEYVASLVRKKFGYENILINPIGPTIGAHAGPGTVGVFFLGDHR